MDRIVAIPDEHIGRVGSTSGLGMDDAVQQAYFEWGNRLKLEAIERAITEIDQIVQAAKQQLQPGLRGGKLSPSAK